MLSTAELTGKSRTHIKQLESPRCALHAEVLLPFFAMRAAAAADGIDLVPFSTWRSFSAQMKIWNRKMTGLRPILNQQGHPMDSSNFSIDEKIYRILHWSALPAASRHHWGTEIDLVDGNILKTGYRASLVPAETQAGGAFSALHDWLDKNAENYGFFRPYASYSGGMYAEPWHLSFGPVANLIEKQLSPALIRDALIDEKLVEKERVLELLPLLFDQFIRLPQPG